MLNKKLDSYIEYKGARVNLTLAFNNILNFYNLQEDERFSDVEKLIKGFDLVCYSKKRYSDDEKLEIVKIIFDEHVNVVKLKGEKSGVKTIDFNQDAGYIFGSFMDQYGINLNDQIDKLDWREFIWLFHCLSDKTMIKKIMGIRFRKVPKRTKNNAEEIENIMELKAMYALDMEEAEREKNFADSLKQLAERFI